MIKSGTDKLTRNLSDSFAKTSGLALFKTFQYAILEIWSKLPGDFVSKLPPRSKNHTSSPISKRRLMLFWWMYWSLFPRKRLNYGRRTSRIFRQLSETVPRIKSIIGNSKFPRNYQQKFSTTFRQNLFVIKKNSFRQDTNDSFREINEKVKSSESS